MHASLHQGLRSRAAAARNGGILYEQVETNILNIHAGDALSLRATGYSASERGSMNPL